MSFIQSSLLHSGTQIAPSPQEVSMHIHENSMSINAVNPYYAATEKAATVRRAAHVRKKLTTSAPEIEGAATPEETLMIGRWLNAQQSTAQSEDSYNISAPGKVLEHG
jgi:hypothetical protein